MITNNDLLDVIENFNEREFLDNYNSYKKEIIVAYNHKIKKSNESVRLSDIHHELIKDKSYEVTEKINYIFNYPSKLANLISIELENAFYYNVNYDIYDKNSIFLCCKKETLTLKDKINITKKNFMGYIGVYISIFLLLISTYEVINTVLALGNRLNVSFNISLIVGLVASIPVIFGLIIVFIIYCENSERKFRKYITL